MDSNTIQPNLTTDSNVNSDAPAQQSVGNTQVDEFSQIMSAFEDTADQQGSAVGEGQSEPSGEIEIDERFKDLPEVEARLRTYQSRYDKLYNEHQKLTREYTELLKVREVIDEIQSNPEALEALIRAVKPELLPQKDIAQLLEEKLQEEFGDYKPSRDEIDTDPRAWLYYERMKELYNELKGKANVKAKTIQEITEDRKRKEEEMKQKLNSEIQRVKNVMKWDDDTVVKFTEWAQKLTIEALAKMFNFAIKTMRVPSVTNVSGVNSDFNKSASARDMFLNTFKKR